MTLGQNKSWVAIMERFGSGAATLISNVSKWMYTVGAVVVFIMMVLAATDAILRYLSPYGVPGTVNFEEFFMAAVVFLGMAFIQAKKGHVRVDLLILRLRGRIRAGINVFVLFLAFGVACLITWQGWIMARDAWLIKQYTHGTPHLPIYPSKFLVPFGGVLLCLQLLVDICGELWQALEHNHK
jgi:TRAP-type mannitol/chloroaromatic compound transport system permease small subunit